MAKRKKKAPQTPEYIRDFTSFGNNLLLLLLVAVSIQSIHVIIRAVIGLVIINLIGYTFKFFLFRKKPKKGILKYLRKEDPSVVPSLHVARSAFVMSLIYENVEHVYKLIPIIIVLVVAYTRVRLRKHVFIDTLLGLFIGLGIYFIFS